MVPRSHDEWEVLVKPRCEHLKFNWLSTLFILLSQNAHLIALVYLYHEGSCAHTSLKLYFLQLCNRVY